MSGRAERARRRELSKGRAQDELDAALAAFGAVWVATPERPEVDAVAVLEADGAFARVFCEFGRWRWATDTANGRTTSCALASLAEAKLHASVEVLRAFERRVRLATKALRDDAGDPV